MRAFYPNQRTTAKSRLSSPQAAAESSAGSTSSGPATTRPHRLVPAVHEALVDRGRELRDQRVVIAARVHDHDRPEEQAEPLQRDRLEELLERAGPARERDDGRGSRQHLVLARAHVFDDVQLREVVVAPFELHHELRDHADDAAARGERAVRERTHRARAPAAIDDGASGPRQELAEPARDVVVGRVAGLARGAVDADAALRRPSAGRLQRKGDAGDAREQRIEERRDPCARPRASGAGGPPASGASGPRTARAGSRRAAAPDGCREGSPFRAPS